MKSICILKQKSGEKTYYYLIENVWCPIEKKRKRVKVVDTGFKTQKEADWERARIMAGVKRRDSGKLTFREVAEEFEAEYKREATKLTAKSFSDYNRHALAFFGNERIDKIDRVRINQYRESLKNNRRSERTLEIAVRIELRKIFKYALKMGYIQVPPIFDSITKPKSSLAPETLNRAQLSTCINLATKQERYCILFMLYSAMRAEEFVNMTWANIYFSDGYIAVLNHRANKEQRKVPITLKLRRLLGWAKKFLGAVHPYGSKWGFAQALGRIGTIVGLHLTPTIIRKTAITMYVSGGDWLVYSKVIGHKDPKTTAKYYFALDHERVKEKMDGVKFR